MHLHPRRLQAGLEEGLVEAPLMPHGLVLLSQETMPQTSVVFSSILGPSCSGQGQPSMGERGGGASGSGDLIFQDGRLISGSLEALMEHLVPTVDYYPDVSAWSLERGVTGGSDLGSRRGCFWDREGGPDGAGGGSRGGQGSEEPQPHLLCLPCLLPCSPPQPR